MKECPTHKGSFTDDQATCCCGKLLVLKIDTKPEPQPEVSVSPIPIIEEPPQRPTSQALEISPTPTETSRGVVKLENENLEMSAETPLEMAQCHDAAIEWCRRKIKLVKGEAKELWDAYKHSIEKKWKSGTLKKHAELADKRATFFEKMLAAFEAGYYIVPNFPATVFAIRTDKSSPTPAMQIACTYAPRMTKFVSNPLPQGEGEYQNPEPTVRADMRQIDDGKGGKKTVRDYWCDEWQELEFPANMARLRVMGAATRAMALKVFDEICMLPSDRKRHADPILIGTIICKTKSPYQSDWKRVSFMIAWHIDTRTL